MKRTFSSKQIQPYAQLFTVGSYATQIDENIYIYRVSQEECEILQESVPYVKQYRYNPKHLYPKLNGYGDNGQRKVWTSCISAYCTSTAVSPLTLQPPLSVVT